jgi:hypothetical protein
MEEAMTRIGPISTLPLLILFSGHSPSQDAKAEAFRNRDTSVPISA